MPARYQLVSLEFDDQGATSKQVFLLDSQTGRVWRYQAGWLPPVKDNKPVEIPEIFIPIQIMTPGRQLKTSPED
ncbi:MAG: hypothetical protein ABSF59_14875 [Candidatus Sulfotelmatobacter sp.]